MHKHKLACYVNIACYGKMKKQWANKWGNKNRVTECFTDDRSSHMIPSVTDISGSKRVREKKVLNKVTRIIKIESFLGNKVSF